MVQFSVANGQIIDPNGKVFTADGINIFPGQVDATTILQTFPGINMVRLAANSGTDPNTIDSLVQGLTSKGVVVEIEDHAAGGTANVPTGAALTAESAWYASLAAKYVTDPYVAFGTMNEPDNIANEQAVPDQEAATYAAIRGTGSHALILLEERGGGYSEAAVANSPATYAGMTNVVWDEHYYGWATNSSDSTVLAHSIQGVVQTAQTVRSADGLVPVIIGEYGPSTTGSGAYDANGLATVQAVGNSGVGRLAWNWNAGSDALTSGYNALTDFGHLVADNIAANATATPTTPTPSNPTPPPSPPPTPPPTQSNYITPGQGSFTDAAGNTYSIDASKNGDENGKPMADSSNTGAMVYANGQVYGQDANSQSWYTWNQATWTAASAPPAPTPVSTPPAPATDTLQLSLAEDAYQGDAQAVVTLDGKAIGGTVTVTALHAQGQAQTVTLTGPWGPGAHDVGVQFINDAYGGTPSTDRNLYVNAVTLDGQASTATPATLYSNGMAHMATAASPLVLQLSEDAYLGDAQFSVAVDGHALGGPQSISVSHASGGAQDFSFGPAMAAGTHDVAVSFLNDAWGGTSATDRNLYVNAVDANGAAMPGTAATLMTTSTQHFSVVVAAHA